MFEFVKNLNLKLNNVLGINDKKVNEGVPYVADLDLEREINQWLKSVGLDNFSFGLVLLKLGFSLDKTLYLKRDKSSDKLTINYGYENKLDENKRLTLSERYGGWEPNYGSIIISDGSCEKYYYSKEEEADFVIVKVEEIVAKEKDGVTIISDYMSTQMIITIKKEDSLEIKLNCKGNFNFEIKNELKLEEYLASLTLPVLVEDVYKKICEISLGDESNFLDLELTLKKENKELASLINSKTTYSSGLFNGEVKFKIKDSSRDISYQRYLPCKYIAVLWGDDSYAVKIIIENGDYGFCLSVKANDFPKNLNFTNYELDNEIELRDYLLHLEFPIKIEEVFKRICEISLGDISKYIMIKLDCSYKGVKINSLYLRDGKFNFYKDIRDEKEISVDNEGNFIYKSKNEESSYSIEISGNTIKKYEYESDIGIDMSTDNKLENPMQMVIDEIKQEKVRTRKLIDEIIK